MIDQKMQPISIRVDEASTLTGMAPSLLYRLIRQGDINAVKVGRLNLIPLAELRSFMQRNRTRAKDGLL
ncbi:MULTISPECIES: helix-turn-helix domain-containing protein [unclassified Sphingomonas]|uniref:helix-turn-helix domain-containing protein n=1 Tax=unclassified Sphingomonas TaxID=196159 RepID=UPI002151869F|nr:MULTISPECIES: helix-turn-helix domain-containing protein [unclassified Sphingomonas]MCR5871097.1 helix-turn-helix domain-containing protein [Sphingomonas sp. J344]UUY00586.1 helix-turn-helix domain-containing protein [Sphingomonas sp. J315]